MFDAEKKTWDGSCDFSRQYDCDSDLRLERGNWQYWQLIAYRKSIIPFHFQAIHSKPFVL